MRPTATLCLILLLTAPLAAAAAAPTPSNLPVPRFVSLKFGEVNGRAGPSEQHPILWKYYRRYLPVQVVAETETWRRVRDPDGELVWMHRSMLDGRRTAIVTQETALHVRPDAESGVRAVAEPGVVVMVRACRDGWRRVSAGGHTGWTSESALWGAGCGDEPASLVQAGGF